MTRNLEELLPQLYEDFDKVREKATHYTEYQNHENAIGYFQAGSRIAANIISIELGKKSEQFAQGPEEAPTERPDIKHTNNWGKPRRLG